MSVDTRLPETGAGGVVGAAVGRPPPRRAPEPAQHLGAAAGDARRVPRDLVLRSYVVLDADRRFLLPPPHRSSRWRSWTRRTGPTSSPRCGCRHRIAALGLLIAIVLGMAIGIAMSQARWVERSIYPYAVILQCVPILALVPVIGFWFDFGLTSRLIVTVLIALFPVISSTLFGLQSADRGQHELFTLHRASRLARLLEAAVRQRPCRRSSPGFQVAATLAVVGAVVGDFFFKQGDARDRRAHRPLPGPAAVRAALRRRAAASLLGVAAFCAVRPDQPGRHRRLVRLHRVRQAGLTPLFPPRPARAGPHHPAHDEENDASTQARSGGSRTHRSCWPLPPAQQRQHHRHQRAGAEGIRGGPLAQGRVPRHRSSIQTDWFPESRVRRLYQLLGPGYTSRHEEEVLTRPAASPPAQDTGVKVEIRNGGPAIGFQQVSAQMYADKSITLGQVAPTRRSRTPSAADPRGRRPAGDQPADDPLGHGRSTRTSTRSPTSARPTPRSSTTRPTRTCSTCSAPAWCGPDQLDG